jgi:sec-independent protein translocase protein TatA
MHAPSIWQLLIIGALVLLLFGGKGKISGMMEELAKGIKGFKKGLSDEEAAKREEVPQPQIVERKVDASQRTDV